MATKPPPSYYTVDGEMLNEAIVEAIRAKSYSVTGDMDVLELRGVTDTGESFPIEKLEVSLCRKRAQQPGGSLATADLSGRHFPAGKRSPAGKLRLAAVDGERLQ